jgi:CRISPR system Cascade subunit CasE
MTLHLIRLPIRLSALARWGADRGWVKGKTGAFDEGRALHHLLSETFGKGLAQPFRLLVPPRANAGNLYAYSAASADSLRATARAIALPEHLGAITLAALEGKPMPTTWTAGQRLGFDLLARPVRRLNAPLAGFAKGAEVDAFLAHVLHHHPATAPDSHEHSREAIYLDWLAERLEGIATLDRAATALAGFRRRRVARGGAGSEGPEATIHGTFEIRDPAQFAVMLARGVGRHRAYGYGMLLLRAPNRPTPGR